jgi:hypothetical protein
MEESKGLSPNHLRLQGATDKKDEHGVPTGLQRMGAYNNKGERFSNSSEISKEQMLQKIENESNEQKSFHALSAAPGMELENKLRDAIRNSVSGKYSVGIHYKGKEYLVEITPLTKEIKPVSNGKRNNKTRKHIKQDE